jgi:BirA family transcriptional regulator, biotin operon repressor / biotin---[acetyl-CoA-carboxylase] ligase
VDSTNSYIRRQVIACDPLIRSGVVVSARTQTAGRGRKERSWHSGRDMSLTFSFLLDISGIPAGEISGITIAAGVAVASALRQFGLECKVKWPNDIFVGEKKLCGILTETVDLNGALCAICGIGMNINLDNRALESIDAPATSIYAETAIKNKPSDVLAAVLESLEFWIGMWLDGRQSSIAAQWMKIAYGLGKSLKVMEAGKIIDQGFFVGLGEKGQLILRRLDSSTEQVWGGDIVWEKDNF